MTLFDYLQKYVDQFNENFPTFMFMTISEDEIIEIIKDCIAKNKPYIPDGIKDNVYY